MEKDRGFRVLAIVAICIAVVGLSIGYAALQQTLNINTKATVTGDWNVEFQNLGTAELAGTATVATPATLTSTLITIDVSLIKPGDSVTYTFDVVNEGNIDAKLSAPPTIVGSSEAASDHILYSLTYANGDPILANDELDAGQTRNLKLVVSYDSAATSQLATVDEAFQINASLIYIQK